MTQIGETRPVRNTGNPRKYRLLILNLYTEMGGGEYALYNTLRHVDRDQYVPVMVFPRNGTFSRKTEAIGIETVILPYPVVMLKRLVIPSVMLRTANASKRIHHLMREKQIDAVQCSDILSLLLLAFPVMVSRVPVVYCVIFFYEWIRMLLFNLLALMLVDSIVTNSPAVADDLRRKTMMLDDKITTVAPGVDTDAFRPLRAAGTNTLKQELQIDPSLKLVGMVGRFDPAKGHHIFLEAATSVLQSNPAVRFVVVGGLMNEDLYPAVGEYYRMVLQQSQPLLSAHRLFFIPEREDAAEVIRCLDVLVCPSVNEGFGLVVLEALASGVPVVLSRSVGAWNLVQSMPGVYPVAEPNAALFTKAILAAMGEKQEWHDDIRRILSSDHSWNMTARAFESTYKSLITREIVSYHYSQWSTVL